MGAVSFLKKRSSVDFDPDPAETMMGQPDVVALFTDGGYQAFGKLGAWAFVAVNTKGAPVETGVGCLINTTNNRMEMRAVIEALSVLEIGRPIVLFSDSEYVLKGLRYWVNNWVAKGWTTAEGNPVKNQDLWLQLQALRDLHTISFKHVYGHSGNGWNEHVDQLCTQQMKELSYKQKYGMPVQYDEAPA